MHSYAWFGMIASLGLRNATLAQDDAKLEITCIPILTRCTYLSSPIEAEESFECGAAYMTGGSSIRTLGFLTFRQSSRAL